jgi:hypothetical protein
MTALADVVCAAVARAVEKHAKLFADAEKARRVLAREIMRQLAAKPAEAADPPDAPAPRRGELVPADDERALAYCRLREVAGAVPPMRTAGGQIYLPPEAAEPCVLAFGTLPPRERWAFVTGANLTAWLEFFGETLPGVARRNIVVTGGATLPWAWPPSKTGRVYQPLHEEVAP